MNIADMSTMQPVPDDLQALCHVKEWRHAEGIPAAVCPDGWADISTVLRWFRLLRSKVVVGGGNRSSVYRRIASDFYVRVWVEKDRLTED